MMKLSQIHEKQNYIHHSVGASFTFLCHLYCKLSQWCVFNIEVKNQVYVILFFSRLAFVSNCFDPLYSRFIEQPWIVNITCRFMSVVLSMCFLYTEEH